MKFETLLRRESQNLTAERLGQSLGANRSRRAGLNSRPAIRPMGEQGRAAACQFIPNSSGHVPFQGRAELIERLGETVKEMVARNQSRNEAFAQATKTASAIATSSDLNAVDAKEAVDTFWKLYWGELARFEGQDVETAMVRFGRSLQTWQATGKKPEEMAQLSLAVSHACRNEIDAYDK
ncbi:hypothetical protein [Rhizobium ruizarguesonis]|uniref:hypothetical protein n=1 Tax=Rhizobium ruizarguesonis TaxID=2081791 RepID=UPI0010302F7A|nr:hypothetical protein [Rhizobium ruizarguesonis]MBY5891492.1 hypothetical protein [Rhizobium leguminosarum]QSZ04578.1 hypothetical protein J3P73_28680 [Rhizobium ruizarguesonis]TBA11050.1 hypothetical protein ELH65_31805 [Rhizobium ruizarguesonis]